MLVYPAGVDLSTSVLRFLTGEPAARRREQGTRWRRLSAGRQALLVLAHLRCGHTCAQLATGFGVATTTAYRYIAEAVGLLASLAPTLAQAVKTASTKAFVILDGTLLPIARIATDRPFYSGKHKKHGMNAAQTAMLNHPHHRPRPGGPHPAPDVLKLRLEKAQWRIEHEGRVSCTVLKCEGPDLPDGAPDKKPRAKP